MVSIVIPNLNGLELLKICLPSVNKQTFKNIEVLLVDNDSNDGSIDWITNNFPQFKIIKLSKNYGFARAVNNGIKKSAGDFIFLLNNDTEVDKKCLDNLVKAVEAHPEVGFVSAKILNFYNRNLIDNAGDYLDSAGHLLTRGLGENEKKFQKGEYIFSGTGGGTLFKRELFKKIGLFDEDFFFYMEDADLCFRAQLAGFKGWFEPKAKIYHKRMATSKSLKNRDVLVFQNMTIMILKDFPKVLLLHNFNWLKIFLVHLNTIRHLFFSGHILSTIYAEFYLITNLIKTLKKRRKIQSLKSVDDSYILKNVQPKSSRLEVYFQGNLG